MDKSEKLCSSRKCPFRAKCLRYTAVPTDGQEYTDIFTTKGEGKCEEFIPNSRVPKR